MNKPIDINAFFSYQDTLVASTLFFAILALVEEALRHWDDIMIPLLNGGPEYDLGQYLTLHRNLNELANFTIRYSERMLSIHPTDPDIITTADTFARYQNLLNYHTHLERINERIQHIIIITERSDFTQAGEQYRQASETLIENGNRLRLAGNTVVRILRSLEGILRDDNVTLKTLPTQWFER